MARTWIALRAGRGGQDVAEGERDMRLGTGGWTGRGRKLGRWRKMGGNGVEEQRKTSSRTRVRRREHKGGSILVDAVLGGTRDRE